MFVQLYPSCDSGIFSCHYRSLFIPKFEILTQQARSILLQKWVGLSKGGVGICSQFGPYRGRDLTLITVLSEPSGIAQGLFIANFLYIHVFSFVPWNKLFPKMTPWTTIAGIYFYLCFNFI